MLIDLDRIVVAARYREPVVQALRRVLGAEVVGRDQLPLWSAKRTTLRAGVSEIEVLEPNGVGAIAVFIGRRGPGLFAVGFASADLAEFRTHLEAQGVFFEEHEDQLFLTSDKGVDLPGLNLVITPAKEREPAGLLQHLCAATLLHRAVEPGGALLRILGLHSSQESKVTQASPGFTGTVIRLGGGHLAIVAPWGNATPIGQFFFRHGSGIHLASAVSENLAAISRTARFHWPRSSDSIGGWPPSHSLAAARRSPPGRLCARRGMLALRCIVIEPGPKSSDSTMPKDIFPHPTSELAVTRKRLAPPFMMLSRAPRKGQAAHRSRRGAHHPVSVLHPWPREGGAAARRIAEEVMEAIWVAAEMRAGGAYAQPARSKRSQRRAAICVTSASLPSDLNSYGLRRGNHEVMVRGTFASVRIRNLMTAARRGASRAISQLVSS